MRHWVYTTPLLIGLTALVGCSSKGETGEIGPQGPRGNDGTDGLTGPSGPTGPYGMPGPMGVTGAEGPVGPAGATGPAGPAGPAGADGKNGKDGATGATGAKGDPGVVGPTGPTGVVTVLYFDQENVLASLAANTNTIPNACRTQSYTAGPGEAAVIHIDGSLYPQSAPLSLVSLKIAAQQNGGAFTAISTEALDSLSDGVSSSAVTKYYPLNQGTIYVFGAQFYSAAATGALTKSTCHGTVTIVRP